MFEALERYVIDKLLLKPASTQHHKALIRTVEEVAEKAGMPPPKLYIWHSEIPNAGAFSSGSIMISEGLLDTLGHKTKAGKITKEVRAVIAHELSHVQNFKKEFLQKSIPPLLAPVVAVIACKLIIDGMERHKNEKKAAKDIMNSDPHDILSIDESSYEHLLPDERAGVHAWRHKVATAAKYMAAAGLGIGAGLIMRDRFAFQHEYRADALAAKLVDKGAMISALKKIGTKLTSISDSLYHFVDKDTKHAVQQVDKMLGRLLMPHPSLEQRISHMNSLHL